MISRRKIQIGAVILVAVILIAAALVIIPRIGAPPPVEHSPHLGRIAAGDSSTPSGAVVGALGALRDWDLELAAQWMSEAPDGIFTDAYRQVLASALARLEFEPGSERVTGNTAIVDVSVIAVDMSAALGDISADAARFLHGSAAEDTDPNWASFLEQYINIMDVDGLIRIRRTTTAHLIQDSEGQWRLDTHNPANRGFYNVVSGGLIDILDVLGEVYANL